MATIKVYFRKNLSMSSKKLAAQVTHAVMKLASKEQLAYPVDRLIVLEASNQKFWNLLAEHPDCVVHYDGGKTEVAPGTPTTLAYMESQ